MGESNGKHRLNDQRRRHAEFGAAIPLGQAERIRQRLDTVGFVPTRPGAERRLRDAIDRYLSEETDIANRLERASGWTIDNSVREYLFNAAAVEESIEPGMFHTAAGAIWPLPDDQNALDTRDPHTMIKLNAVFVMLEAADRIMTATETSSRPA